MAWGLWERLFRRSGALSAIPAARANWPTIEHLEFVGGAVIGDDARYRPSTSQELVKRALHAAGSAFTARAASGKTRPAYSRVFAVTAALLIANRWQPLPKTGHNLAGAPGVQCHKHGPGQLSAGV